MFGDMVKHKGLTFDISGVRDGRSLPERVRSMEGVGRLPKEVSWVVDRTTSR